MRETDKLLRELVRQQITTNCLLAEVRNVSIANMGYLSQITKDLNHPIPTSITFKEITMLPPVAGNTLVYTGTLSPVGASFPSDTVFTAASSDTTVSPTVDSTGLIVTIPLPTGFVDDPANPFNVVYTATSVSAGSSIAATITPSLPVSFPTGIVFTQTT